jgi:hypothetical protein
MKKTTNFAESPDVPVYKDGYRHASRANDPASHVYTPPPRHRDEFKYDSSSINYKFNECELIEELQEYIDTTYDGHYSADDGLQATDLIMAAGRGQDFCVGNILKYAHRYEKKGTAADARKDLMKVLHYGIMAIYAHDKEYIRNKEED